MFIPNSFSYMWNIAYKQIYSLFQLQRPDLGTLGHLVCPDLSLNNGMHLKFCRAFATRYTNENIMIIKSYKDIKIVNICWSPRQILYHVGSIIFHLECDVILNFKSNFPCLDLWFILNNMLHFSCKLREKILLHKN